MMRRYSDLPNIEHMNAFTIFSEEQARTDNTIESDVVSYLEDLEKLLLARKLLVTQQEKKEVQELRDIDRRHDRTAMGRIESTQHAIIEQIETLKVGFQNISDIHPAV
jgi:hypothetical protein